MMRGSEDRPLLVIVLLVTAAFVSVIWPYSGAILWGIAAAIMFLPVNRRFLESMPGRRNSAALLTLLLILLMVILPAIALGGQLVTQAAGIYEQLRDGQIDISHMFSQVQNALPAWAKQGLGRLGLDDFDALRNRLSTGLVDSFQLVAGQALTVGQGAISIILSLGVMLYLTFFLLRDGEELAERFEASLPLKPQQSRALVDTFAVVVRATIKGSLVVAVLQGLIGGVIFAFLGIDGALFWGVAMGLFSLIPAVGSGLVWVPVAIYLLVTGQFVDGIILALCGVFIISMVDNIVRPILVGRDTKMPDYVVFISTLGGLQLFGFNGLIIGPVIAALFITVWKIYSRQRAMKGA